jgi:ribonuclease T2
VPDGSLMRWAVLLVAALAAMADGRAAAQDRAGDFDFYVLALSWSPTWCAGEGADGESAQCREGSSLGFIVHGLWPQRERGYPQSCPTDEPQRVPLGLADEMADLMPDRGLVFSQWRKHGTCTGLSQSDYFALTRAAAARVAIPPDFVGTEQDATVSADTVERAFLTANPEMPRDGVAVTCEDGKLEEVRICLTRDLGFRACQEVDRRGCRQGRLSMPAPG